MKSYKNICCAIMLSLLSFTLLAISSRSIAQSQNQSSDGDNRKSDERIIRYSVFLIMVEIDITDRDGNEVADLTKDDFTIYEDGVKQEAVFWKRNAGSDKQIDQLMYVAGYYPPNFRFEGEWRKIRVSVRSQDKAKQNVQFVPKGYYTYREFFK